MSTRRRQEIAWARPAPADACLPFVPAIERATTARHGFSVCLYQEPEFAERFPGRDFAARYLARMPRVAELFARQDFALAIFADTAMLDTALGFGFGSVYHVATPPAFAFAQHLYRYYAALLPVHPTVRAWHFRGLDNLLVKPDEIQLFEHFLASGCDILHAPYLRNRGSVYTPVRGSCSVANAGITSLACRLQHTPPLDLGEEWPARWHNDELWLSDWFNEVRSTSRLYTVVDRVLPPEFHAQVAEQVNTGLPFHIARVTPKAVFHPSQA